MRPSQKALIAAGAFVALAAPTLAIAETDPLRDPAVRHLRESFAIERLSLFDKPASRAVRGTTCADSTVPGLTWCAAATGYETSDAGTYSRSFGYNLDAAGRVVYVILTRREFPLARGAIEDTVTSLGARYGRPPTTLKFTGKTADGDDVVALVAYWGNIKLVRLTEAELRVVAQTGTLGRGPLVDYRQNLRESAQRRDPVYRIEGTAGVVAEFRSVSDVRTDFVLRAVYAPAFSGEKAARPEAAAPKFRDYPLDPGLARALAAVKAEAERRAAIEKARREEQERKAAEERARREEEARRIADERLAEQERIASLERARQEEEDRKAAEARRVAEEAARRAEERARREEAERKAAEARRLAEERARREEEDRKAAEAKRIAEQRARMEEAERKAAAERRALEERARRAEAEYKATLERVRRAEAERKAAEDRARQAEAERLAAEERTRRIEAERKAAEARVEAERRAEEKRAEERRLADERRLAEERARREEAERKAAEARRAAEERASRAEAERKAADERRAADARRNAEEKRMIEERAAKAEALRKAAEERAAQERSASAERRAAEERLADEERRAAEQRRTAEDRQRAEQERAAEERARRAEAERRAAEAAPPAPPQAGSDPARPPLEQKVASVAPGVGAPVAGQPEWRRMAIAQSRNSTANWIFERVRDPISEDLVMRTRAVFSGQAATALEIAFECNIGAGKRLTAYVRAFDAATKASVDIPAEDGRAGVVRGTVVLDEDAPQTAFLFPERGQRQASIVEIPLQHEDVRKNTPRAEAWLRHYRVTLKLRAAEGEAAATIYPYAENLLRVLEACSL